MKKQAEKEDFSMESLRSFLELGLVRAPSSKCSNAAIGGDLGKSKGERCRDQLLTHVTTVTG